MYLTCLTKILVREVLPGLAIDHFLHFEKDLIGLAGLQRETRIRCELHPHTVLVGLVVKDFLGILRVFVLRLREIVACLVIQGGDSLRKYQMLFLPVRGARAHQGGR